MKNKQMKALLKSNIEAVSSGEMLESQSKEVYKQMRNLIKFSRDELEYKKLTHSDKKLKIYE